MFENYFIGVMKKRGGECSRQPCIECAFCIMAGYRELCLFNEVEDFITYKQEVE